MKYVARHNKFYGALVKNLVKNPFFASSTCMYFCSWHASKQFSIFSPFFFIICYWILSWSIKKINFVCLFDITILIRWFFFLRVQCKKENKNHFLYDVVYYIYSIHFFNLLIVDLQLKKAPNYSKVLKACIRKKCNEC